MKHATERTKDKAANEEYEHLAFELPEFYLRRLKKTCIDKNILLNQLIVYIIGDAVKNWPEEGRNEQKLPINERRLRPLRRFITSSTP